MYIVQRRSRDGYYPGTRTNARRAAHTCLSRREIRRIGPFSLSRRVRVFLFFFFLYFTNAQNLLSNAQKHDANMFRTYPFDGVSFIFSRISCDVFCGIKSYVRIILLLSNVPYLEIRVRSNSENEFFRFGNTSNPRHSTIVLY